MINSMTGFGRGEVQDEQFKITIEMKSVNHRYLDVNVRVPRKLSFCEQLIRKNVKKYGSRGKVDVFVNMEYIQGDTAGIKYNEAVAAAYRECVKQISQDFQLAEDLSAYRLSKYPEVIMQEEESLDEEKLTALVTEAMENAGKVFQESRRIEDGGLCEDLLGKLKKVSALVEQIKDRSPEIVEEYRQKITERIQELIGDSQIDERVLATELILYADKICVDEEIVRLQTHVAHMTETLTQAGDAVGRKLDFLTQEMNREANTILSKANDSIMSEYGIELKTEIEKIREQIQNIE